MSCLLVPSFLSRPRQTQRYKQKKTVAQMSQFIAFARGAGRTSHTAFATAAVMTNHEFSQLTGFQNRVALFKNKKKHNFFFFLKLAGPPPTPQTHPPPPQKKKKKKKKATKFGELGTRKHDLNRNFRYA